MIVDLRASGGTSPETSVPLAHALDEWLRTVEIEETTRRTYVG
jgi:hypothetical protein